jgi:galactonate dehydratase
VRTAVEEMGDYLIGKDASPIEDVWQVLYRGGFYSHCYRGAHVYVLGL